MSDALADRRLSEAARSADLESILSTLPPEAAQLIRDFQAARGRVVQALVLHTPLMEDEGEARAALIADLERVTNFIRAMDEVHRRGGA